LATYAIGDLQGCYAPLRRLLDTVGFDPSADHLWFAGDLVNRGPESVQCLRFIRDLGERTVAVLGNHDLHLLAAAHGGRRGKRDTLGGVLSAPDRDELLDWLRHRPLLHESADGRYALLHAGLPPQWDMAQARRCAREAEHALQDGDYRILLNTMYGDQPDLWDDNLTGIARLRFIINCYSRLRYCDRAGRLDFACKSPPGTQPAGLLPWFAVPGRHSSDVTMLCGHWSTLGRVAWPQHRFYGLDTGCIWGEQLTALKLDDETLYSVDCPEFGPPVGGAD